MQITTWRFWLEELALDSGRVIMPVALDTTAYDMPAAVRKLNYLRPNGLPLPAGDALAGPAFEEVVRSLLKQITEALCRVMLPKPAEAPAGRSSAPNSPLPKVNIFLSHAKVDGTRPARRLRDYIYSQTQLTAFFDENDIAYGSVFGGVIDSDLKSVDTAALIAVRTAGYASRPWCRREFSLFRRPRPVDGLPQGARRWFLYPALVVEAMTGGEPSSGRRGIRQQFGDPVGRQRAELEELIVTTVIRDAMLASFHSAMGAAIQPKENQIVINWLPDPTTLLHILASRPEDQHEIEVVYPGRGLSFLDLDALNKFFPNLTFRSFEEALS